MQLSYQIGGQEEKKYDKKIKQMHFNYILNTFKQLIRINELFISCSAFELLNRLSIIFSRLRFTQSGGFMIQRAIRVRHSQQENKGVDSFPKSNRRVFICYCILTNTPVQRVYIGVIKLSILLKCKLRHFIGIILSEAHSQLKRRGMKRAFALHRPITTSAIIYISHSFSFQHEAIFQLSAGSPRIQFFQFQSLFLFLATLIGAYIVQVSKKY